MNLTRPVTIEEVTASAEAQVRMAEEFVANMAHELEVQRRYARMLRKKWKRAEAMARMRDDSL